MNQDVDCACTGLAASGSAAGSSSERAAGAAAADGGTIVNRSLGCPNRSHGHRILGPQPVPCELPTAPRPPRGCPWHVAPGAFVHELVVEPILAGLVARRRDAFADVAD